MYDMHVESIAKDLETVLGQMSCLNIHNTIVRKEQRPDNHFALAYVVKFKHLHKNIRGEIYFGFNDVEFANGVAMSIANKNGSSEIVEFRDDYLCEFMNTATGIALSKLDKIGFYTSFEPPETIENYSQNIPNFGVDSSVILMTLDVGNLLFKVAFIDCSHEALAGRKILVVDDSMLIRQLLFKKLAKIGLNVEMACDGMDAIEKAKTFEPELIIMDQIMPKLNGLDAIVEIVSMAPDTKFIMLSSTSSQDELNTASTLNVQAYLKKPLNLTDLYKEIIKAVLT